MPTALDPKSSVSTSSTTLAKLKLYIESIEKAFLCQLLKRETGVYQLKRETGVGPATSTLARLRSTTELFPRFINHILSIKKSQYLVLQKITLQNKRTRCIIILADNIIQQ